jgi:hypothetical protein
MSLDPELRTTTSTRWTRCGTPEYLAHQVTLGLGHGDGGTGDIRLFIQLSPHIFSTISRLPIPQTIPALLDSDMFKHKDTPDRNRKVSGSLSSGSMDSSETASLDSNMEEQQKAAREVWDRHTNPGSELSMAKRRMMVDREVQSRAAKGGNAGVVRRLEEAGPNRHGRWWQFCINRFFSKKVFDEKTKKGFF